MSFRKLVIAFVLICLFAIPVIAYLWPLSKAHGGSLLKAGDKGIVARGEKLYAENCASCHGQNLEGEKNWRSANADGTRPAPPHNETGHTWHHSDEVLFNLTKLGLEKYSGGTNIKTNMPAYEGTLADNEIVAVLSFIKAQWPEKLRKRHDQLNAASKPKPGG